MATRIEELINDLTIEITVLRQKVEVLQTETRPVREIANRVAVIECTLAEMTKTKELWGQRGWMIMTILLSSSFSFLAVIVGALFTFYLNSRK